MTVESFTVHVMPTSQTFKPRSKQAGAENRRQILAARDEGKRGYEIAREMDLTEGYVYRVLREARSDEAQAS